MLAFTGELSAFVFREILCPLEEESVIEAGDAVVATRNDNGKARLHLSLPLDAAGSALGSFSGTLLGMLPLTPMLGSIAGAANAGIDDKFMKSPGETLTPGSSALFIVVRKSNPKQIELLLEQLKPFAGCCKILECNMPAENEVLLRNLLEGELPSVHSASVSTTDADLRPNS